VETKKCLHS